MNKKIVHVNYTKKSTSISGDRLPNDIDWDLVDMQQWYKQHSGLFQIHSQSTLTPKLGKLIIIGTTPDDSTNSLKELFLNNE